MNVRDGWVTLTGYVEYEPQRLAAYDDVATLDGVTEFSNAIALLGTSNRLRRCQGTATSPT